MEAELCFPQLRNTSCTKPVPRQPDALLGYVFLSLVSLITAALNLMIVISISHFRQLHSPTNLLILSLAVSDFLVGFLLMPVEILATEACWFLGDHMCALSYVLDFIITSSSVGNMVLISIDRYLAICDPLRYPTLVTLDRTKICILVCWICSVLYNTVLLRDFLRRPDSHNSCYGECVIVHNHVTGTVDFVFIFVAPVSVIVVLYMRVFSVAVYHAQAMRSHVATVTLQPPSTNVTFKKSEMKAAMILGVVVIVFLTCFCPYYSPSLLGEDIEDNRAASSFTLWLLYFNSCLNPVIYALFYPWFRKSMKLIVTLKILKPDSCDAKML